MRLRQILGNNPPGRHEKRKPAKKFLMTKNSGIMALILIMVISTSICMVSMGLTQSYFTDTDKGQIQLSTGSWGDKIKICCVCPNWGICGACMWPVFIFGEHFEGEVTVELIKDGTVIEASKSWVVNSSLIFTVFDLGQAERGLYDVCVIAENGQAVLEHGFLVKGWFCCVPLTSKDYPAGEDKLSLEKMIDANNPDTILFTVRGELPAMVEKALLVAPGQLLEGKILDKKHGLLVSSFDISEAPALEYDLVVVTGEGWNLLLEKALAIDDLLYPMHITAIDPPSAPTGTILDLKVCGEHFPDVIELFLEGEGTTIKPLKTSVISTKQILCTFDLREALQGKYSLRLLGPTGLVAILADFFEIIEIELPVDDQDESHPQEEEIPQDPEGPPDRTEGDEFTITPDHGRSGETVALVIQGGPFREGMRARLTGPKATSWTLECKWPSSTFMECTFNLFGMPGGIYRLEILDYRGKLVYTAGVFEVIEGGR